MRDSDDPRLIESFLRDELRDRALRLFGASPLPAAAVQLARLRMRLSRFAECQAEMRRDGWSLRHCEIAFTGEPALPVPDQPAMPLRGIIDRIDLHEPTGRWRVIDYKTGESGDDPMRAHHGTKPGRTPPYRWLDLQLPLYHHLVTAGELRLQGEVELGYIVLPRQLESTGFRGAAWDSAALQDAMRRAAEIVVAIRAGEFPLNREHAPSGDAFARLCHTGALGVRDGEDAA